MEKKEPLPVPEAGRIDPETFRRVWERVMPDQRNSPIVVQPGGGGGNGQPRSVPGMREKKRDAAESWRDGAALHRLMDLAREGELSARELVRRSGSRGKRLGALAEDNRRALRRLSAFCFLVTGQRHQPVGRAKPWRGTVEQGLRERFWWEREWVSLCRELEGQTDEESLRELCEALAREGEAHCRMIRGILEEM